MSTRDRDRVDPEDLVVRARRGPLNRAEQRELERALEHSADLRLAYQLGADMDRASALRGGDEALIARAANAALLQLNGQPALAGGDGPEQVEGWADIGEPRRAPWGGGSRWLAAAAIVLAVVSVSGMAAALWSGVVTWPLFLKAPSAESAVGAGRVPAGKRKHAHRAGGPVRALGDVPVSAGVGTGTSTSTGTTTSTGSGQDAAGRVRRAADAGALFHAANAARRSGDFARAERLYSELIGAHPGSEESGLARVSLAKLRLSRGDAQGAESEFRRYLAAGRGQLDEEALVGQAQSFARLGRARAERDAWQRLLVDHPSSVYAEQARKRLAALSADKSLR